MSRSSERRAHRQAVWNGLVAAVLIAGTYFLVFYLAAEATCAPAVQAMPVAALRALIYAATVLSGGALAAVAHRSWLLRRDPGPAGPTVAFLGSTGLIVCGLVGFFVLLVASPVIGSSLC